MGSQSSVKPMFNTEAGMAAALPTPPATPDMVAARQEALDDEILELAQENAKKVVLVLRSWLEASA